MRKEVYDLIVRFRNLSNEDQKEFLKSIIIYDNFDGYVENEVKEYKPPVSYPGAKSGFKERLENKIEQIIDKTFNVLKSQDRKLKYRLFSKYIDDFDKTLHITKEEICGEEHDYSEWEEKIGERPRFNASGQIESFYCGTWFQRECHYCGKLQKAWDEKQKKELTENSKQLRLKNGS